MAWSFRESRKSQGTRPTRAPSVAGDYQLGPYQDPYTSANWGGTKKRKSTTKRTKMAKKRRTRKSGRRTSGRVVRRAAKRKSRPRRLIAASTMKRRRRPRRRSIASTMAPKRRRRRRSVAVRNVRRPRRGGRRRPSSRGGKLSMRNIQGQAMQAIVDGAWIVAGDMAGNLAKIFSGQSGIIGNVVQLAGGLAAGMLANKVMPRQREAARFIMAGAASGVIRQYASGFVTDMVKDPVLHGKLSAALAGYPHTDYEAYQTLQGYTNAGSNEGYVGMPGYAGQ